MNKREEAKQEMRLKILTAARKAFSDFGYEGTSFKTITEDSGAGRQLIIYHFTNKEELWKETVLAIRDDFITHFLNHIGDIEPLADRERGVKLSMAFMKATLDVPEYCKIVSREGMTPSDRLAWFNDVMQPDLMTNHLFRDPDYAQAAYTGLGNHLQAGIYFYLANMKPVMNHQKGNDAYPVEPLSDKTMERVANLIMDMIESLVAEIKAAQ